MAAPRSIHDINKEIVKVAALSVPGVLAMAVGLYGFFVEDAAALHPLLEQPNLVVGLLGFGFISWLWYSRTLLRLAREKAQVLGK